MHRVGKRLFACPPLPGVDTLCFMAQEAYFAAEQAYFTAKGAYFMAEEAYFMAEQACGVATLTVLRGTVKLSV